MDLKVNNDVIKSLDGEVWKSLYDNYYISSYGRLATNNWRGTGRLMLMKPAHDANGYLRTMIKHPDGSLKTIKLHRLVCTAFHQNPENKPQVNHIDGVRDNNNSDNLEWCTNSENQLHSIKMGTFVIQDPNGDNLPLLKGEDSYMAKLTEKEVLEIRSKFIPRKYTRDMLGAEYNVSPTTIKDIILRRTWKHI